MANQFGGSGNDTFTGTSNDDQLVGNDGDDSLSGEGGNDALFGGAGNDSVSGGEGDDEVAGQGGNDRLEGGAGNDSVNGGEGDDFVSGGAGDDVVTSDKGDDTVYGGDGNDSLSGGDGNDTLDGGAGDDTITGGGGADVFVIGQGGGSDVIKDFQPQNGDVVAINYPGITNYSELKSLMSSDGNWGTFITFPDGEVTHLEFYDFGSGGPSDFTFDSGPICFLKGTLIETQDGEVPVQLVRPGTLVRTRHSGWQPVLHVHFSRYRFGIGAHKMKPIRIKAGALGPDVPRRDLRVSPQHRIALPPQDPAVLVPAVKLLPLAGVTTRDNCRLARYYHLVLPQHELIRADGLWAETMLVHKAAERAGAMPQGAGVSETLVLPERRRVTGEDLREICADNTPDSTRIREPSGV